MKNNRNFDRDNFNDGFNFNNSSKDKPNKSSNTLMVVSMVAASVLIIATVAVIAFMFIKQNSNPAATPTTAPTTTLATVEEKTEPQPTEEGNLTIPEIEGMSAEDAYNTLNNYGIKYNVSREFNSDVPTDYVIRQSPEAGNVIKKSDKVTLYISKGSASQPEATTNTKSTVKPSESNNGSSTGAYILDGSDSRYVAKSEVIKLSKTDMTLALNEIYARHGRRFNTSEIQAYFDSKLWYSGTVSPENFNSSVLNDYENSNINLIVTVMEEYGYR